MGLPLTALDRGSGFATGISDATSVVSGHSGSRGGRLGGGPRAARPRPRRARAGGGGGGAERGDGDGAADAARDAPLPRAPPLLRECGYVVGAVARSRNDVLKLFGAKHAQWSLLLIEFGPETTPGAGTDPKYGEFLGQVQLVLREMSLRQVLLPTIAFCEDKATDAIVRVMRLGVVEMVLPPYAKPKLKGLLKYVLRPTDVRELQEESKQLHARHQNVAAGVSGAARPAPRRATAAGGGGGGSGGGGGARRQRRRRSHRLGPRGAAAARWRRRGARQVGPAGHPPPPPPPPSSTTKPRRPLPPPRASRYRCAPRPRASRRSNRWPRRAASTRARTPSSRTMRWTRSSRRRSGSSRATATSATASRARGAQASRRARGGGGGGGGRQWRRRRGAHRRAARGVRRGR